MQNIAWPADKVERRPLAALVPYARNARTHSEAQVAQIAASMREWGWTNPVLIAEDGTVIAGHGRLLAAQQLGWSEAPVMVAAGWSEAQRRAYALADNQLALLSGWDEELLSAELQELKGLSFDTALAGFSDADLASRQAAGTGAAPGAGNLAARFLIAPFSVLNAREGWWQERKRSWLALGIQSEVGRAANLLRFSKAVLAAQAGVRPYAQPGQYEGGDAWGGGGTSVFDPVLCEVVYRWFCPPGGTVLDPFAGGSVRGVVAGKLGRRYLGVELRAEQVEANREQAAEIFPEGGPRPTAYAPSPEAAEPLQVPRQAGGPEWARGYALDGLRALAALFKAHDKGLVLGAFTGVKETQVADWLEAGALQGLARAGTPLAAAVAVEVASSRAMTDFSGAALGQIQKGDLHVRRFAGDPHALAALFEELPAGRAWLELWQEKDADVELAEALGFRYLGSKIRASSEIVGIWARGIEAAQPTPWIEQAALVRLALPQLATAPLVEALARLELAWADHYSGYNKRGTWSALALRGYGGREDFIEKPAEMSRKWKAENPEKLAWELADTSLLALLPEAQALMDAVPGRKHRVRLMRLAPRDGELTRHADITDPDAGVAPGRLLRIHIPLVTNEQVVFRQWLLDGRQISAHMAQGDAWYLDTRKPHTATNEGESARIHLVLDVESCPELLALVRPEGMPSSAGAQAEPAPLTGLEGLEPCAPEWLIGDSRNFGTLTGERAADMIFSCPPYADLERYSDDPADLSTLEYPDFRRAYSEIVSAACRQLKDHRFAAFIVGEVRAKDGAYYNFVGDTVRAFLDAGLAFYNEAIVITPSGSLPIRAGRIFSSTRKLGKTHQNLLVFVKGDARKAVEACGEVFVELPEPEGGEDPAAKYGEVQ